MRTAIERLTELLNKARDPGLPAFLRLHYLIHVVVPACAREWGVPEAARELADLMLRGLGTASGVCDCCHRIPVPPSVETCPDCTVRIGEMAATAAEPEMEALAQFAARSLATVGIEMTPGEVREVHAGICAEVRDHLRTGGYTAPDSDAEITDLINRALRPTIEAARCAVRQNEVRVVPPDGEPFCCFTCGKPREGRLRIAVYTSERGCEFPVCRRCFAEPPTV